MKPNAEPWLKGLLDLRPRFDSLADEDLRYLLVRHDMDFATATERYQTEGLEFLPTPRWVDWRERRPILLDQARHCVIGGNNILCRHILYGKIQASSGQKFRSWAEEAGRCLAARPTAEPGETDSFFEWLLYICITAQRNSIQSPLKAVPQNVEKSPCAVDGTKPHFLLIPGTIFRASVSTIDVIAAHFGDGYDAPALMGMPTDEHQPLTLPLRKHQEVVPVMRQASLASRAVGLAHEMHNREGSINVAAIARLLGCERTKLYRLPGFRAMVDAAKKNGEVAKRRLPRGEKDQSTRSVEAWSSE